MKHYFLSMATWINLDPRRARLIILTIILALMLMALVMPSSISVAGLASGGGD